MTVDVGREFGATRERFLADCTPTGATTFQEFDAASSSVTLTFAEPLGTWSAQSLFVPATSPAR